MDEILLTLGGSLVIAGLIGAAIGERRGRPGAGFVFGFLLGPLGWILIAVGPNLRAEQSSEKAAPAQRTSQMDATTDALLNLKKLSDSGILSSEEYESKKSVLLARFDAAQSETSFKTGTTMIADASSTKASGATSDDIAGPILAMFVTLVVLGIVVYAVTR